MMDERLKRLVSKLSSYALSRGASSAKLIRTEDITVGHWVRLKCMYGCDDYGKYFTCPPYTPTPEQTRKILDEYRHAMLFEFRDIKDSRRLKSIHNLMLELERIAFLDGFYKAFAFIANTCTMCDRCPAGELSCASKQDKKLCLHPEKARPSMQACGIDVFSTARKAGYDVDVVTTPDKGFKSFTLLLIE